MPELPEVELVKKRLQQQLINKKFAGAKVLRVGIAGRKRNIGEIYLTEKGNYRDRRLVLLEKMGIEPLSDEFNFQYFSSLLGKNKNKTIKILLMDQKKIAGIGNIYSDEILYQTGFKPTRFIETFSLDEQKKLFRGIKNTLLAAVVDVETGKDKNEITDFLAPDRRGFKCKKCGGRLVHEKIGGRTSVYCKNHQK